MVDLACSTALLSLALLVALAYGVRVVRHGAARFARVNREGRSPLLGQPVMQMGYWAMRPLARAACALGITANAVSWTSLVLAAAAGLAFSTGHFGLGAVLSLVSSSCDALDGMIARETATASQAGEVLDAAIDRYAELLFFAGVAVWLRRSAPLLLVTLAATAGAVMVSYATAKAESLQIAAPRGAMRRPERAVYLVVGALLVPVAAWLRTAWGGPSWIDVAPLAASLTLVAAIGNFSAVARLAAVARQARELPAGDADRSAAARPERGTGGITLAGDVQCTAPSAFR
jgi:phosphatidylglycerophosphate synthase